MDLISRQDLSVLLETHGVCASIYLSTHARGPETPQDPIRLKNLLESAERQMLANDLSHSETKHALEPVRQLVRELPQRRFREDGLAIFVCPGLFRCFHLPIRFQELAVVARRFHITPLLPLLSGDGQFYVLAISENSVRLFEATRYTITQLDTIHMPESLREALRFETFERQLQLHSAGGSGGRTAVYHGHVSAIEDTKQNRLRYFRQIDAGVRALTHHNRAPLVLAAVEEMFPLYREANTHPLLLERGIAGNPDRTSAAELHAAAWEIAGPYFSRQKTSALSLYRDLRGTNRSSDDLCEILAAMNQGRVERLFIKAGVDLRGSFDPGRNEASLHLHPEPGDEDLLNLAATQAILHGATAYALPAEEMPYGRDVAALFRY
jgi:Bacterial archaeo-eukaryotic release factor family 7